MDRFLLAVVMQVLTVFWFVVTIILTTRLWLLSLVDAMQRGKWSKPQRIDCGDYPETESVALASDDHGNVFAMSQQRDKVFVRRFTEANGWSMAEAIGDATYVISSTSITCDVHGNALAVWHAGHRDHAETWINRYTIRNGWGKAERFDCSPGEKSPVNIVGDAQGHAIAVWFHNRNGRSLILCKRYMPDTGWSEATTVAESDRLINTLKLIGDRQGRCFILWDWQQNKSGKGEYTYNGVVPVYASYYTATNGWSYATKIADDVLYDKVDRLVAELDNLGNVIVVWAHQVYKAGNDRADIWAVRYDVVNGWDKASAIEPGIEGRSENKSESAWPKIAFDSAGNALVVWQ